MCALADDDLLVHWTKVAAPWMELPHCAYLTAVSKRQNERYAA